MTKRFLAIFGALLIMAFASGCTSLGHNGRSKPMLAKPLDATPETVIVYDDGGVLAGYVIKMLDSHGISVLDSPDSRVELSSETVTGNSKTGRREQFMSTAASHTVKVSSVDLDICLPEGSRQMHFNVTVTDNRTKRRVFSAVGRFGCASTITKNLEQWILSN